MRCFDRWAISKAICVLLFSVALWLQGGGDAGGTVFYAEDDNCDSLCNKDGKAPGQPGRGIGGGDFELYEVDFAVVSCGTPFQLDRYRTSSVGNSWTFGFRAYISGLNDKTVHLKESESITFTYITHTHDDGETYTSPDNCPYKLRGLASRPFPSQNPHEVIEEYVLTNTKTGEIWIFDKSDGQLKETTNESLQEDSKVGWTTSYTDGLPTVTEGPVTGGTRKRIVYNFNASDQLTDATVEVSDDNFATNSPTHRVEYTYHNGTTHHADLGNAGSLIQVAVKTRYKASTTTWQSNRYRQYRYYSNDKPKSVYESEDLDDIQQLNSSVTRAVVLTKSDTEAIVSGGPTFKDLASQHVTYYSSAVATDAIDTDWQTGEDLETRYGGSNYADETGLLASTVLRGEGSCCGGSTGSVIKNFYYLSNGDASVAKIVVEDTVDSNGNPHHREVRGVSSDGYTLRTALFDVNDSDYWCESWIIDSDNYVTEHRMPSAHDVASDAELRQFLDPSTSTNDADTLFSAAGLIEVFEYDSEKNKTGTRVKNGAGTGVQAHYVSAADYDSFDRVIATYAYPTKTTTRSSGTKTEYEYTPWYTGQRAPKKIVTKLPVVPTGENGSGVQTTTEQYFDEEGNLRWEQDGEGYINYYSYDPAHTSLAYIVIDADPSSLPTSEDDEPSKWYSAATYQASSNKPTRSSGLPAALQLVSTVEFDSEGHEILAVNPEGAERHTIYEADRSIVVPVWDGTQALMPARVTETDESGRVTQTYRVRPQQVEATSGTPTGLKTSTTQADWVSWTRFDYYPESGNEKAIHRYHAIPSSGEGTIYTNFYTTAFLYDAMGRLDHTISHARADGQGVEQVTKHDFDLLGRRVATYRGVSNSSANIQSDYSNLPSLALVGRTVYDEGLVGDGHATRDISYYGTGATDNYGFYRKYTFRGHLRGEESVYGYNHASPSPSIRWVNVYDLDWEGNRLAEARFQNQPTWSSFVDDYDDEAANPTTITDNHWSLVTHDRDSQQRIYRTETFDVSTGSPGNHARTEFYYDRNGRLVATAPHGGAATEIAFDGAGRQFQERSLNQLDSSLSNQYVSGKFQYRAPEPDPDRTQLSGGNEDVVQFSHREFDGAGNVTGTHRYIMAGGSDGVNLSGSDYVRMTVYSWFDLASRMTAQYDYGDGDLTTNGGQWKYIATVPSRSATIPTSYHNSIATLYSYNADHGRLELVEDDEGKKTKTLYDDLGRVTYTIDNYVNFTDNPDANSGGGTDGSEDQVVKLVYDGLDNKVQVIALDRDGSGGGTDNETTKYLLEDAYNASFVTSVIHPDSTDTTSSGTDQVKYTYGLDGLVETKTDQREVVIDYDYLSFGTGRVLEAERATIPSGSGVDDHVKAIQHFYDSRGRRYRVRSFATTTGGTIRNDVFFDRNYIDHRVDKSYQSHEGAADTSDPYVGYFYDYANTSGVYDNNQRLYKLTYPDGNILFRKFSGVTNDRFNRISSMEDGFTGSTAEVAKYLYAGNHRLTGIEYTVPGFLLNYDVGNDAQYEFLDRWGRVKSQRWAGTYFKDRWDYEYDEVGNRTARKLEDFLNSDPNFDQYFTYDSSHRLKTFTKGTTLEQDWTLDQWGNWSGFTYDKTTSQTRTHNDANETLTISSWQNPAHDDAGNMTSIPDPAAPSTTLLTLKYDAWNRLVEVKRGSTVVATYEYDGLHRRIVRIVDPGTGSEKEYHSYYSLAHQELEVREGSETADPFEQFVWHPHYIDALAIRYYDSNANGSMDASTDVFYATHDANFNVTAFVDTGNAVVERYGYSPYGEVTVRDGPAEGDFSDDSDGLSDYENTYTYTGRRFDWETGLYYYRARYYSPNLGVFVSRDPIGFLAGDVNLQRYVLNGPVDFLDPSGLDTILGSLDTFERISNRIPLPAKVRTNLQAGFSTIRNLLESESGVPLGYNPNLTTFAVRPASPGDPQLTIDELASRMARDAQNHVVMTVAGGAVGSAFHGAKSTRAFVRRMRQRCGTFLGSERGSAGFGGAPNNVAGNPQLGSLIKNVSGKNVSAAEKVRLLQEGAGKIDGITFDRQPNVTGASGVFKGSPFSSGPMQGRSPVLAVLDDGTVVKGFDIPHPFGKPYNVIDISKLK